MVLVYGFRGGRVLAILENWKILDLGSLEIKT